MREPAPLTPEPVGVAQRPLLVRAAQRRLFMTAIVGFATAVVVVAQRQAFVAAARRAVRVHPALLAVAVLLEALSMAAAAELQRRLLSAGGVRARRGTLLALVWATNAVAAALAAGAAASTVYSYRHLTKRGTPPLVAGWLLGVAGALSGAALALFVVVGLQLRGLLSRCTAEDVFEVAALTGVLATSVGVLAWLSAQPRRLATVQRHVHHLIVVVRRRPHGWVRAEGWSAVQPSISLSRRGWGLVASLAVLTWGADSAVLALSLAAVGAHPHWRALVLAYALSQLAVSLPALPGSLGIAEGSLVVVLACAGVRAQDALAAALLYRLASFWLQLPPGCVAWVRLRKARPFERERPESGPPRDTVELLPVC